jgi:hypothetical protein
MSYLTLFYVDIAIEGEAYAAAPARKQKDLILDVCWNNGSCQSKDSYLFFLCIQVMAKIDGAENKSAPHPDA